MLDDEPRFLHPISEIAKHTTLLPHWQQGQTAIFVTFRTADSIPQAKLTALAEARASWNEGHAHPWSPTQEREYHRRFTTQIERWLDQGEGECLLRDPRCSRTVGAALDHFHGDRYTRHAWVVMPNHVHVLFSPLPSNTLDQIVHAWKSFTAHAINRLLRRSGSFWQRDYHDRLIRNRRHFDYCVRYIADNPIKARLPQGAYRRWSESVT